MQSLISTHPPPRQGLTIRLFETSTAAPEHQRQHKITSKEGYVRRPDSGLRTNYEVSKGQRIRRESVRTSKVLRRSC